ncbi:Peptidoglycan/LPS O-acetylase OafA/YrhL, contains acyltransferase and SGNH-hydrolase domains [Paenibacillus catalpae]|uniref:Peptidoglycan/LPS O-acetylase OafA/YrhL, contains acyltransferase and SGNH-hydrolase domains n=1 Tax=Paenibacillus catalpae TaxID=1045775 RepID=A0A1I2E0E0_9BACL|nr:acyltransferase [Paenibacillus catalpae]SFE86315.1 Peptidoglycan/LPS O-acetylase OafA/YrhL, contains acyltransferase and SGNH-hydrolase domains [Paenibacillus catalpae]
MENSKDAAARSRLPEIQLVRALLIIAVIMIHATSFATLQMKDSSLYPVYHFLNVSMAFATPAFVFLSGFVLFYSYYTRPLNGALISTFYRKRITFVIIPYVLFSIIYFILYYNAYTPTMPAEETFRSFLIKLATGKAYTHLYYVFIMAQMYVLFPILLMVFRRFSGLIKWAVPAALLIQLGFFIWNEEALHITNLMSWAPSYATQYMLGAVLGIYYPQLRGWLHISREHAAPKRIAGWLAALLAWLCCLAAMLVILYDTRMNGTVYSPLMLNVLKMLYSVTSSVMLLLAAPFLYRLLPGKGLRVLDSIAALSFGIYLLHPLLLFYYRKFPAEGGTSWHYHVWYAVGFGLALGGTWLIVAAAARFLPGAALLFGELPRKGKSGKSRIAG